MKPSLAIVLGAALQCACAPAIVTKSPGAHGRVTNARTHAPVAQAQVSFPDLRVPAATTDRQGRYDIPYTRKLGVVVLLPLEFANTPLQVTHPGYQTFTRRIFHDSPAHRRYDIALEPKIP